MTPREKHVWLQRLACLQSLSLEKIATEVNEKRWRDLLCTLAAPTEAERRKMHALIKKYDAGKLDRLPTDMRADGGRMLRVLIALHRMLGAFRDGVFRHDQIIEQAAPMSLRTSARAVDDLDDARLIDADRKRERPRRYGGQGPSKYRIVWSTIINLAAAQGLQFQLQFDEDVAEQGHPPAAIKAETACRPQMPSAAGEPIASAAPQNGNAPCHSGNAPCHSGNAPCHESGPNARAGASFLPSFPPSSPSAPTERPLHTPSAEQAPSATQKEEKVAALQNGWHGLVGRLQRYGVLLPHRAINAARAHGWTADQVNALLASCEARTVDDPAGPIRAWGEGLVFRHLQNCPAGAAIAMPPSEKYVRAARNRDLALARRVEDAKAAAQTAEPPSRIADEPREAAFGATLDALSADERDDLAAGVLNPFEFKYYRKHGCSVRGIRFRLLRELERRAAAGGLFR